MYCEICRDKRATYSVAILEAEDEFIACPDCAVPYRKGNWLISDLLVGEEIVDFSEEEL